jgi:hypothetical protein
MISNIIFVRLLMIFGIFEKEIIYFFKLNFKYIRILLLYL